jgi:hypothetical protein
LHVLFTIICIWRFLKLGVPPNHPNFDNFCIEPYGFGDPHLRTPHIFPLIQLVVRACQPWSWWNWRPQLTKFCEDKSIDALRYTPMAPLQDARQPSWGIDPRLSWHLIFPMKRPIFGVLLPYMKFSESFHTWVSVANRVYEIVVTDCTGSRWGTHPDCIWESDWLSWLCNLNPVV